MKAERKRPILYASKPQMVLDAGSCVEDNLAKAMYYFLYLTGGRINEATEHSNNKIEMEKDCVEVFMKTLKTRKEYKKRRRVLIPLGKYARCYENEMWKEVWDYLGSFDSFQKPFRKWKNMSEYLARKITLTAEANVKGESGVWYDKVITKRFNPHYLRRCRATHLVSYYDFNPTQLVRFFGWSDVNMSLEYTQMKDLRDAFLKR